MADCGLHPRENTDECILVSIRMVYGEALAATVA